MESPLLVTCALPYANGPLHFGHLVESVQADALVRFQRLRGRDVLFVCADDMHGTPIELNARKQGIAPEQFVEAIHASHVQDYAAFNISFDEFYKTHSPENEHYARLFFDRLKASGHVVARDLEQFFCEKDQRFLPDRFVRGACPKCSKPDQYGDVCENCNSTYAPTELKDPRCVLCATTPVRKKSRHQFVQLSHFADYLEKFVHSEARLQPEVRRFVDGWLAGGLSDWCISRDGPYFGFEIPGEAGKFFYVWLDAPIGYLSSTVHRVGDDVALKKYWSADSGADIWHFIGKDIIYFHTLFWPAMLHAAKLREPARVFVHGMLTVNGEKMSKSRGTFINASDYVRAGFDPEHLRYYLASLLGPSPEDIDFSLAGFRDRINGELNNNLGNFCNRALKFVAQNFEGRLAESFDSDADAQSLKKQVYDIFDHVSYKYEKLDLKGAMEALRDIGIAGNGYLQKRAPWSLIKTDRVAAHQAVSLAADVAKLICIGLTPIVPKLADELRRQLGIDRPLNWADRELDLRGARIGEPKALTTQIEAGTLEKLIAAPTASVAPTVPEIDYAQFESLDLRCGLIVAAERVPKADKLLKLSVDLGDAAPRTIAAGIAAAYEPAALVGKRVVVVANLKARAIRGIESRGMLLAASGGAGGLALAELPNDVAPGSKVK